MPTPTYDLLASNVLGTTATSVTFSSIPTTGYRDLVLVMRPQLSAAANCNILLNSSTSGYSFILMMGLGSSGVSSDAFGSRNALELYNAAIDNSSMVVLQFMDYARTDRQKFTFVRNDRPTSFTQSLVNLWANTSAINSIQISATTFNAGSSFYLYGIAS